jgi:hypothetical protein
VSDRPSYEWVRPPRWRRWLLRLLVLLAFIGVGYGLYTIVKEGTKDDGKDETPELEALQRGNEQLAVRLEALKPTTPPGPARTAARRALTLRKRAVLALKRRQTEGEDTPQESEVEDALNKDFDWLDGVNTVLANPDSRLTEELGDRGQDAIDAFEQLDEDYGIALSIRGVAALTDWAEAH